MRTTTIKFKFKKLPNAKVFAGKEAIKGASSVSFDFSNMIGPESRASKITIDWGDGSPVLAKGKNVVFDYKRDSIFDEVLYGAIGGTVLTSYSHDYFNDSQYYGKDFFAKILITWEDGTFTYIVQPITVFWDSFYDDVQELSLLSTQILPVSTNETFINLESKYDRATLIGAAKTSGVPLVSAAKVTKIEELDPIAFGEEGLLATSNFNNIVFPFIDGDKFISIVMGYEILDTCNTVVPYYRIIPNKTLIGEGEEVIFYVFTDGVPDGTKLYFKTSRTDLTVTSGFIIIQNNTASFTTSPIVDNLTEGYKVFNVKLKVRGLNGTVVATSDDVGITDEYFVPGGCFVTFDDLPILANDGVNICSLLTQYVPLVTFNNEPIIGFNGSIVQTQL